LRESWTGLPISGPLRSITKKWRNSWNGPGN